MSFVVVGRVFELLSREVMISGLIKMSLMIFVGLILPSPVISFFWAVWTYNNYRYQLTREGFKIESGVVWKKYIFIPYERIQNIDLARGIIARLLGLSDLHIQTAGYSGRMRAEGRIPGLGPETAENLREDLIKRVKGTKQGL